MSQPYIDPTALCVSGSTGIEPTASAKLIGPLTACLTGGGKTGGGNTGGETGGETGGGDTGEETGGGENEGGDTVEGATQAANLATKSCSRPYLNMSCMSASSLAILASFVALSDLRTSTSATKSATLMLN